MPDCAMAAAADYISLVIGQTPNASEIGFDFAKAGGTNSGMTLEQLRHYWSNTGVGGTRLTNWVRTGSSKSSVMNALRIDNLLYVDMKFHSNSQIENFKVSPSSHAAVVDGFTPKGPLLVTWGTTVQMTWQQWRSTVVDTFALQISSI
jgi:hypothetical protein